jgi:nucleoside-diphosphate-sugar epimerase
VANLLTANAYTKKTMTIFGKDQTRPFVHVNDAAYSIICALETKFNNQDYIVFNIGSNAQNCTLLELAELIQKQIPDASIVIEEGGDDARNYNVSFDRADDILGFKTKWTLEDGIKQVIRKFESGEIEDYSLSQYSNVKHLHEQGLTTLSSEELVNWEEAFLEETYG